MTQVINVKVPVNAATLSPLARVMRTVLQVVIAVGAAIPTILALPGVAGSAVLVKDLGIAAGYLVIITAVMNALENAGVIPVLGAKPVVPLTVSVAPQLVPGAGK